MSEGNVYEAACEIRDGLGRVREQLDEGLAAVADSINDRIRPRVETWVGVIAAAVFRETMIKINNDGIETQMELSALAKVAWGLADALEDEAVQRLLRDPKRNMGLPASSVARVAPGHEAKGGAE